MTRNRLILLLTVLVASVGASASDSIPDGWNLPLHWRIGVEAAGGYVPPTKGFLRGANREGRSIDATAAGALRCDFGFDPRSRQGMLYRGLYQGVGLEARSFIAGRLLGSPVSVFVYQGAPILRFGRSLWLGYEWRFGAAFGWQHYYHQELYTDNEAVSTPVTACMGLALKLYWQLSPQWCLAVGAEGTHFSNGNTSWPNGGVNAIGASIGLAYMINPAHSIAAPSAAVAAEADRPGWFCDVLAYGAWRKRQVLAGDQGQLCPGSFGVAGLQIAPMRKFNRWCAAGVALDMQYDEGAGLTPYWVEGTSGSDIKFYRPPFGRQVRIGMSAHAELTMPIFAVNVGVGYDMLSSEGNQRFYQSLSLKTFVTRRLFVNTGYRLGDFKYPQNLMLGIGIRF